jgi:hypothetical protein
MEEEANVAAQDLSIAPKYASPPTTCYLVGGSLLEHQQSCGPMGIQFCCFSSNSIANNNHVAQGGKIVNYYF